MLFSIIILINLLGYGDSENSHVQYKITELRSLLYTFFYSPNFLEDLIS